MVGAGVVVVATAGVAGAEVVAGVVGVVGSAGIAGVAAAKFNVPEASVEAVCSVAGAGVGVAVLTAVLALASGAGVVAGVVVDEALASGVVLSATSDPSGFAFSPLWVLSVSRSVSALPPLSM